MLISHRSKFVFIHIHRTGGTTITNLLKIALGNKLIALGQHENVATSEEKRLETLSKYLIFGFVRNPWDRLLS